MNEKDLTAFCGLYCGDCPRYKAKFSDLSGKLLNELEKIHFHEFAKVYKFEHYDKVISLLEILPYLKCESTCRSGQDGSGGSCEVKKCIGEKEIEGCWDCQDFESCEKLHFLKPVCGEAPIKNLRKIKQYGIDNWSDHREKQYPWL